MRNNNLSVHIRKEGDKMIDCRIEGIIIGCGGNPRWGESTAWRRRGRTADPFRDGRRRRRFLKDVRSLSAHYGRHDSQPQRKILSLSTLSPIPLPPLFSCRIRQIISTQPKNIISKQRIRSIQLR